jgi:hypothetical protein
MLACVLEMDQVPIYRIMSGTMRLDAPFERHFSAHGSHERLPDHG